MNEDQQTPQRIGIVAEWNPFHNGHKMLIRTVKNKFPHASLISAMSGSFVERGEPAVFDKHVRAQWAVWAGVDLVVELPVTCVLQSADTFASYGVRLLADLSCDALAFGTESFDESDLFTAAREILSDEFPQNLKEILQTGLPYSRAVNTVIATKHPELSEALCLPNNLLGIQYARTILENHLPMRLLPIHRDRNPMLSASVVRKELIAGHIPDTLPVKMQNDISQLLSEGNIIDYRRYDDACLLRSRLLTKQNLTDSLLFSEGLENKWKKETGAPTYNEMLSAIKSKRYLTSRLRRIGAALLLSDTAPSPFFRPQPASYARILALRESQSTLLRDSKIPVITSFAKALRTSPPDVRAALLLEARATDIAAWCKKNETQRKGGTDYFRSPVIIKNTKDMRTEILDLRS